MNAYLHVNGTLLANTLKFPDGSTQTSAGGFKSRYFKSPQNMNTTSVTATSTWSKMGDFLTFTKARADTKVEVVFNSRIRGGTFSNAFGVNFKLRIDNLETAMDTEGSVARSSTDEFVPMFAVFSSLPAGTHTVSVWTQAAPFADSRSTGVLLDPSGWGGAIIVKEVE